MDPASRVASFQPYITCSTCDLEVPMHLLAIHLCSKVTTMQLVEEPEKLPMPTIATTPAQGSTGRPLRPLVPRIDPFAASKTTIAGELTPVSSGAGSAAASPISPGSERRLPYLLPPRKGSAPPVRRPPSPELLSQDCAFPPFPTSKQKRKDQQKTNSRSRTQTPEIPTSRSFEHHRMRSASVGARSRARQGTSDSSRPSTASSSRQPSMSSRSESRQGSVDAVPPLPALQSSLSPAGSELSIDSAPKEQPIVWPVPSELLPLKESTPGESAPRPELTTPSSNDASPTIAFPPRDSSANTEQIRVHETEESGSREPLYKSKRPPPITNMPPTTFDEISLSKPQSSAGSQPPLTPSNPLTRTLTSLFGRKRGLSFGKRSNSKAPAIDGPRFVALSPDPDPQEAKSLSSRDTSPHSSMMTDLTTPPMHGGIQEVPRSLTDVQMTKPDHPVLEPSQGEMASDHDERDDTHSEYATEDHDEGIGRPHDLQRDTMQLEQDLETRLAAMGAPRLSVVEEQPDDKRASVDSASSYGSEGFSHASDSLRSTDVFDGHSQGSSISTAVTVNPTEDMIITLPPKISKPGAMPDSPTDPYLQQGRLALVPEVVSPDVSSPSTADKDEHINSSFQRHKMLTPVPEALSSPEAERDDPVPLATIPIPPTPSSELDKLDFPNPSRQRRPSTPGACKGICRGCSKRILSGQKSVSSKDGRLTGKYHKECFVCMTCRETFATADFYVHEDHPYCAQHYHEVNGTLCESCGKGIEGHYLETSNVSGQGPKKFHPDCLKCATCKIQLHDDYFELGGLVYCERDAFRMASGARSPYRTAPSRPSPLNREYVASNAPQEALSAGRFPERRLTKLMTTF